MTEQASVQSVLQQTEETLQTARYGYQDLVSGDYARRMSGLRNFVVFGRSVTYALQNLRTAVGKEKFDEWYVQRQTAMSKDPICKHMNAVRNEILKEGKLAVSRSFHVKQFDSSMIAQFAKPRNAIGFFLGDNTGGSGWQVRQPDGSTEKYYVDMPTTVADSKQFFTDLGKLDPNGGQQSVEEVAKHYLDYLEALVAAAKKQFDGAESSNDTQPRKRNHLRVVK